ncbi:winged helix-turn-helix domain-containing protein [Exiguobacterium sp. AM39-5BH]|uniref:winged helix-turn-helix domain-containing protein n=1 Tax=Exiguobacterium sp. AM39-5BH TaxID=2292355 RepID=UPI001F1E7046|nr:winged helix-turn-helix domain-containing protein [Exiguobacterium sp. AM39-5BH]
MSVPGYQEFMYPFLVVLSDGEEHTLQEMYESLADYFKLTESEITEKLPSGQQTLLVNRIGWTRTYLNKAGLIRVVRRAVFQITDEAFN